MYLLFPGRHLVHTTFQEHYLRKVLKMLKIQKIIFAVTSSRTGFEQRGDKEKLEFIGKSQITSHKGEILYRASEDRDEFSVRKIDISKARNKQINSLNNLFDDRKKEFYE